MSRKPYSKFTHTHFKVKAKKLRKKDCVSILGTSAHVTSNLKNDSDTRILVLETTCGPKPRTFLVILANNIKVNVAKSKSKNFPKNR